MGFGTLIAGFILLFNPVIHVVDVIPDAIGFFLIVGGLTKMSYFVGKIQQARDLFWKLALLEVVKFFCIALIPYTSGSALVLLSFVFGVAELLLFVPALNYLFEGISFAGLWYNGTAMYETKAKKRKSKQTDESLKVTTKHEVELITSVKRFIMFFYVFRVCATFIPELTELQMYDNLGEVSALKVSMTHYKPILYILFGFIVLVLAVFYIRNVCRFFGAIRKDKQFIESLNRKYNEDILPKETFFVALNMKRAMMLFVLSVILSFMLFIEGVNLLIGIFSASLLIAAAIIIRKYVKLATAVIPVAVVRAIFSVINVIQQYNYFQVAEYDAEAVNWIETAYSQYYTMASFECVEYILALAANLIFITALMKSVKKHLEIFGFQTENAQYSKRNRDLETYNTIGGKLLLCSVLTILNFSFACAYHYLLPGMDIIGFLTSVVSIVYIVYCIYTVNIINSLVYDKEIEMN